MNGEAQPWFVIVNPAAGSGRCGRRAPDALRELRGHGLAMEIAETRGPGDATELARQAWANGFRRFAAVGGDGTTFEVVNGLFPLDAPTPRPTLSFLPLGTGNSFLRDFTGDPRAGALDAILAGRRRTVDLARLRHRDGVLHYINLLSMGFVADVCTTANERFKRLGEASYAAGVVVEVLGLAPRTYRLSIDGGEPEDIPATFLSLSNSRFTGGKMMMAPQADPHDGALDMIRVAPMARGTLLRTFPRIFSGRHVERADVTQSRVREVVFHDVGRLDAMIDGEVIRLEPLRLEVEAAALDVVI